ncbi:MAG: hypothetical protein HYY84_08585 [Deltaproteobacteria bacterium]|nr:hypothetical protein [Deltaproteobacteria bacterium]
MKHSCLKTVTFLFAVGPLASAVEAAKKAEPKKAPAKAAPAAASKKHDAPPPPRRPVRIIKIPEWKPFRDALGKASLAEVKRAVNLEFAKIDAAATFDVAVALYVLWQEGAIGSPAGKRLDLYIKNRKVSRGMHKGNARSRTGTEVVRYARFLQTSYAMPCEGEKERANPNHLPPVYRCKGAPKDTPLSRAPEQIVPISSFTVEKRPPADVEGSGGEDQPNEKVKKERLDWLHDSTRVVPAEGKGVPKPDVFWAGKKMLATYISVAREIYGRRHVSERNDDMPIVFCSPKRVGKRGAADEWSRKEVVCSSDWRTTVGDGVADSPDWACVGSPEFLDSFVLPGGGVAGDDSGFRCRRRVFRVLQPTNELSEKAAEGEIDKMCLVMRRQTWGDDIAQRVADKEAKEKGEKPKPIKDPPQWPLTREEFLYFYGHTNKYCRANRKLTHRIDNEKWSDDVTFTCGVPRGIVESGPFEEGVQVCATTPYVDRAFPEIRRVMRDANKGRLHCWKFDRPWCKEIAKGETKKRMWISDVFDHYDIVGELRRTRDPKVLGMPDMKKITDLPTFEVTQGLAFADAAKDSGVGSVKEFCRFHGTGRRVVCGYDQKSMAQYYEVRAHEAPEGCHDGICARGQYDRGYMCAVHRSPQIFGGKKLMWVCGYDRGYFGRSKLAPAEWVCTGGKWLKSYVDPDGSRTTLRCGRRAFKFAETLAVNDIVENFDPLDGVRDWVKNHRLERRKITVTRRLQDEHSAEYQKFKGIMHGAKGVLKSAHDQVMKVFETRVIEVPAEKAFYGLGHDEKKMRHLLDAHDGRWDKVLDDKMKVLFNTLDDLRIDQAGFLGHRLTIRNYYLAHRDSHFKALQHFKDEFPKLRVLLEEGFEQTLRSGEKSAKPIKGLIGDVLGNKRAPDGQWFQEMRNALADEKRDLIMREDIPGGRGTLISAFLHFAMFNMLDHTRGITLRRAKDYFNALADHAKNAAPLSRYELLEAARTAPFAPRFHGPLFCVERLGTLPRTWDKVQKKKVIEFAPTGEHICGTSPLLLAGAVEVFADRRFKDYEARYSAAVRHGRNAKDWRVTENEREDIRLEAKNSVGGIWCYGAIPGETAKVDDASRALEPGAGSPWVVDVPKREKDDKRDGWLRCEKYQFSDEAWFLALLADEKQAERDDAGGGAAGGEAGQAMSLVGGGVESMMGKLGDVAKIVSDLGGPDLTMIKKYIDQAMELVKGVAEAAKGNMKGLTELVDKGAKAIDTLVSDETKAMVAAAATPGDATTKAVEAVKQKLAEAKTKFKDAKTAAEAKFKDLKQAAMKLKGSGGIVTALANELIGFLSKKIVGFIEPFARKLISLVMNLLQPLVVGLRTAIAGAVAGIPFGGGALVMAVNAAFDYVWSAIVDLLTNKLFGVIERMLTAGLRAVFGPIVKAIKQMVIDGVQTACQGLGISDFCPSQFAELPPKDRWLEGALACEGAPVVPTHEELNAIAAVARERLERRHQRLIEEAPQIARRFADRHFARYGHTLDSWMAMVGPAATAGQRAIAERIGREMERDVRAQLAMRRTVVKR